ncbi:DUF3265 domain-containing protein [Plesiomonas shigelloides]|nr:DUF3265 domain-containing protein [Plesiomonas shigelloides]
MTSCLRGIRNVWHFQLAMSLVIMVVCGSFCSHCSVLKYNISHSP